MPNSITDPKSEQTEYVGPVSRYELVEPKSSASDARFVASELHPPSAEAAGGTVQNAASQPASSRTVKSSQKAGAKSAAKGTKVVILAGVGIGLLAGLVCAMLFTHPAAPDASTDMGSVTSSTTGLKAHLITNWGDRLNYKLTVEPSDPSQVPDFSNAVNNSPRPLSVDLQLKDPSGTVLCDTPVLLKFDPMKTAAGVTTEPAPTGKKVDEVSLDRAQVTQALNNARLVGQELDREHGKDIFQNNAGPDGQVVSISAQGALPCSKKQYESAASWSFISNFPTMLEADDSSASTLNDGVSSATDSSNRSSAWTAAAQRRRVALPASRFSIEEDDSAVSYQASSGVIETQAGKAFQMERRDLVASALKGVDFPIAIHYRCDQLGACALAGLGSGIQRAWLER